MNELPMLPPKNLSLPQAKVQFQVAQSPNPDGTVDVTVVTNKVNFSLRKDTSNFVSCL